MSKIYHLFIIAVPMMLWESAAETIVNENQNVFCHIASWSYIKGNWTHNQTACLLQTPGPESGDIAWFGSADGLSPADQYNHDTFQLNVSLSIHSGTTAGVMFRTGGTSTVNNEGPSYFVGLYPNADTIVFVALDNGKSVKYSVSMPIEYDIAYSLSVDAVGDSYDVYLDDELVMDGVVATEFDGGSIGLQTEGSVTFWSLEYSYVFREWVMTGDKKLYTTYIFISVSSFVMACCGLAAMAAAGDSDDDGSGAAILGCGVFVVLVAGGILTFYATKARPVEVLDEESKSYSYNVTASYSEMTWMEATEWCHDRGVYLASIQSEIGNDVASEMCGDNECWIGLNSINNSNDFEWTDGTDWVYTNWGSGEPDSDGNEICVSMNSAGFWMDDQCDAQKFAICGSSTLMPTSEPTTYPTPDTADPTVSPTNDPTIDPTEYPTKYPTTQPTGSPTYVPTPDPTADPTVEPTEHPTNDPTTHPTVSPTDQPTANPVYDPTTDPTKSPTAVPTPATANPTAPPTVQPTEPTAEPTENTKSPTGSPSEPPTRMPTVVTQNPSADPTESTSAPSGSPTSGPTTSEPTGSPTTNPTDAPTLEPTFPSFSPSVSPTLEPTRIPTLEPTPMPPAAARTLANIVGLPIEMMYGSVVVAFFGFGAIAYVDAHCIRTNDYFEPGYLLEGLFGLLDVFSDAVFAVAVSFRYLDEEDSIIPLYLPIAAWVFICVPILASLLLLTRKTCCGKARWVDPKKSYMVSEWMAKYSEILYFLSFVTGSSHTALLVLNSAAGRFRIFHMGLTHKDLVKYSFQKLFTLIILEDIPQLAIQAWYLMLVGLDEITIISMGFSCVSILITILTICTQRQVTKKDTRLFLEFHVKFNQGVDSDKHKELLYQTNEIKRALDKHLGLDLLFWMEIPYPYGWAFKVSFPSQKIIDSESVRETLQNLTEEEVAKILRNEWEFAEFTVNDLKSPMSPTPKCSQGTRSTRIQSFETSRSSYV